MAADIGAFELVTASPIYSSHMVSSLDRVDRSKLVHLCEYELVVTYDMTVTNGKRYNGISRQVHK